MICEMAVDDLETMREEGLSPSVKDIIRLNVLGLACELSQGGSSYYELPRMAFLGKTLTFREPTIGHLLWIDSVSMYCDNRDFATVIAIEAFALSRQQEELPEASNRQRVSAAIDSFTKRELKPFTWDQIRCALMYAKHGAKATALEFPAPRPGFENVDNIACSIGVGKLIETLSMGLGISIADIYKMTRSQVKALQELAAARNGFDLAKSAHSSAVGDYIATKNEIIERLKKEKSQNG